MSTSSSRPSSSALVLFHAVLSSATHGGISAFEDQPALGAAVDYRNLQHVVFRLTVEKATRMPNCGRCKSFKFKVGASTAHCTVKIVDVSLNRTYGTHYRVVALIIGLSLVGVVILRYHRRTHGAFLAPPLRALISYNAIQCVRVPVAAPITKCGRRSLRLGTRIW